MAFSDVIGQLLSELSYKTNHYSNTKRSKPKNSFFSDFTNVLDEMDAYLEEKAKDYEKGKRH